LVDRGSGQLAHILAHGRKKSCKLALSQRSRKPLPKIAVLLEWAKEDLLAFPAFPANLWTKKLRSTNPLERFSREIGRRTTSSGSSPTTAWQVRRRLDAELVAAVRASAGAGGDFAAGGNGFSHRGSLHSTLVGRLAFDYRRGCDDT